jgi:hypothetical protein
VLVVSWLLRYTGLGARPERTAALESRSSEPALGLGGRMTGAFGPLRFRGPGLGAGTAWGAIAPGTSWRSALVAAIVVLAGCVGSSDEGRGTLVVVEYPGLRTRVADLVIAKPSDVVLVYSGAETLKMPSAEACAAEGSPSSSMRRPTRLFRGADVPSTLEGFEHALPRVQPARCSADRLTIAIEASAVDASARTVAFTSDSFLHVLSSSTVYRLDSTRADLGLPLAVSDSGRNYLANWPETNRAYLQWEANAGPARRRTLAAEPRPGSAAITDGADGGNAILSVAEGRRRTGLAPDPRYHIVRLWASAPFGYEQRYAVIPCVPDRAGPPFLVATSSAVFAVWTDGAEVALSLCFDDSRPDQQIIQGSRLAALQRLEARQILHAAVLDGRIEVVIDVELQAVRPLIPSLCPDHASVVAVGTSPLSSSRSDTDIDRGGWTGILSFPEKVTWATGVGGIGAAPRRQAFISGGKLFLFSEAEGLCAVEGIEDTELEQVAGDGNGLMLALGKRAGMPVLWQVSDVRYQP